MRTKNDHVLDGLEQVRKIAEEFKLMQQSGNWNTAREKVLVAELQELGISAEDLSSGDYDLINKWAHDRAARMVAL